MQTELFEWSSRPVAEQPAAPQASLLGRTFITLKWDQAIGVVLVLLVFYVLTFSWGVERGRRSAFESHVLKSASTVAVQTPEPATVVETVEKKDLPAVTETLPVEVAIPVTELPKPVASVSKPDGKYTIQHITYVTQSAADREIQRLAKAGQTSFVIPSGKHLQVCIAAFQTRQEASRLLKQLRVQGVVSGDAYVRTIPS